MNDKLPNSTWGLLVVGHGTNSPHGTAQFLELVAGLARRFNHLPVEPAFLELQEPAIEAGVKRLVERGAQRLGIAPLLLFAAGHAKEDVPRAVREALARHATQTTEPVQANHVGCHDLLLELSRRRMAEAVAVGGSNNNKFATYPANGRDCLLLVGRGSKDATATAEMHEFARLREQIGENLHVEVAFLAMAQPALTEQLKNVAQEGYKRVIVQPHLLFHGELLESLRRQVAEIAMQQPATPWLVAPALADVLAASTDQSSVSRGYVAAPDLEKVIEDRCLQAGIPVVARGGDD